LTVSGVALVNELVEVPLAFTNATLTVGAADWLSEGDVVVTGEGVATPRDAHKPGIALLQLSTLFPLFPPPHALKTILVHTRTPPDLIFIIIPQASYVAALIKE
jgi:hypothetical protein